MSYTLEYATDKGKFDIEEVQDGTKTYLVFVLFTKWRHILFTVFSTVILYLFIYVNLFCSDVRIIIDKKAQMSILGTEMDFVQNKLQSEFIFNNPNITGTCGCGESFNIDLSIQKQPRK